MMEISGVIQRIQFYNPQNGYSIAVFELTPSSYQLLRQQKKLIGNRITVLGVFDRQVFVEEEYELVGELVINPTYGLQFKFTSFKRKTEQSEEGIINYLSSDIFPGIGIKTAKLIVEKLGSHAIDKIIQNKDVLNSIGLSKKQIEIVYQVLIDNEFNQQIILFFMNYGITLDMCHKIVATLGPNAIERVKEDPYLLMKEIKRFGFKKNDAFALRLGVPEDSFIRIRAVILYVLNEWIYQSGNSYLDIFLLRRLVNRYLGKELEINKLEPILQSLIKENLIFKANDGRIFDYSLYHQELELAQLLVKRLKDENQSIEKYDPKRIEKVFNQICMDAHITFDEHQKIAIQSAFSEPIVIITGGPGTGKTTIVRTIIEMYLKLHQDNSTLVEAIALLAPTGRAAKRLKEVTNIEAQTIHRFLGYQGDDIFLHGKDNPTDHRLVIVDEASMMDLPIAHRLITSLHPKARLIIVGDVDQLPSVGPGQILKDMIDTKEFKTIRLSHIHRQAEDSHIIRFAHELNEGLLTDTILTPYPDRKFIRVNNEALVDSLIQVYQEAIHQGYNIIKDIQVLAPMYRGEAGITELNQSLQALVNPNKGEGEIKSNGQSFRLNDKVIQLVNRSDKNIMNGDIGIVNNFLYTNGILSGLTVLFDSGGVDYTGDELEDLKLAYAISIHKAQGSEFDFVIVPFTLEHSYMLKRKLIYTSVTRAKKILVMLGDINVLASGIKQIEASRSTILRERIKIFLHEKLPKIDDSASAFDSLGEREFGNINPYDFE